MVTSNNGFERFKKPIPESGDNQSKVKARTASTQEKKNAAESFAGSNNTNSDDVKYQIAVESARNSLADKENVTDDELKASIDDELKYLGASKSGADIRGENGFTQALDFGRNFINDATLAGGNLVDGIFDNTIGNLAGLVAGDDAANSVKGLFDGEDLQGAVDIATDIGLAAAGPIGWGVMLGKNAIQQSDNIMQGLNGGKDRITREDIGLDGAGLSLLEGLGGTALAAVPVVGKMRNLSKLAKPVSGAASKSTELMDPKAAEAVRDQMSRAFNPIPWQRKGIDKELAAINTVENAVSKAAKAADKAEDASKTASKEGSKNIVDRIKSLKIGKGAEASKDGKPGALKTIGSNIGNSILGVTTSMMPAAAVAVGNGDDEYDPASAVLPGLVAGLLGKKGGVSMRGNLASKSPVLAYSALGGMKAADNQTRGTQPEAMSDEEILAALKVM